MSSTEIMSTEIPPVRRRRRNTWLCSRSDRTVLLRWWWLAWPPSCSEILPLAFVSRRSMKSPHPPPRRIIASHERDWLYRRTHPHRHVPAAAAEAAVMGCSFVVALLWFGLLLVRPFTSPPLASLPPSFWPGLHDRLPACWQLPHPPGFLALSLSSRVSHQRGAATSSASSLSTGEVSCPGQKTKRRSSETKSSSSLQLIISIQVASTFLGLLLCSQ